jgi:PAS domain S-box-containing protein
MSTGITKGDLQNPTDVEETIRALQAELAETNRGLIALSWELEQRVDERTTQLRAAHDELQRTNAELMHLTLDLEDRMAQRTESEARFRNLAETASDAILSADSHGKILYFNPAAERIFSYSSTEIIGQPLTLLMPERFHDPHRQGLLRFLETGEARIIGKTVELAARRKNGSEFPIQLALSSWKTREGAFFTAILSDITERKRAEESLMRHRSQLAHSNAELAANKELEAFSYSVSHDLRTPLRSIDGFSQALLEDYADKLDSSGRDHLQRVPRAAQRMAALIDDMLNLSRVARSAMRREMLDLSAMAKSIAAELREAEPGRRVEFAIENDVTAAGDSQLVRAAMENLIGNAWKYTSRHPRARIEFGKSQQNGKHPFFVRDDGAGFDPRYADRLFGAFQRLHTATEFPGTGVGLATVQRIIHRHGGEIWAEGVVEQGATFYFTL